jgi:hypothetical protein
VTVFLSRSKTKTTSLLFSMRGNSQECSFSTQEVRTKKLIGTILRLQSPECLKNLKGPSRELENGVSTYLPKLL